MSIFIDRSVSSTRRGICTARRQPLPVSAPTGSTLKLIETDLSVHTIRTTT